MLVADFDRAEPEPTLSPAGRSEGRSRRRSSDRGGGTGSRRDRNAITGTEVALARNRGCQRAFGQRASCCTAQSEVALEARASRRRKRIACRPVKTSLGIWAFGTMSTRLVPGGYQPQAGEPMHAKVERAAAAGLGDLIDGYEFHYPGELSAGNLDGPGRARRARHLLRGERDAPRSALREGWALLARRQGARRGDPADARGGRLQRRGRCTSSAWPGSRDSNYPFQTPYKESWARFLDGIGQAGHARRSAA